MRSSRTFPGLLVAVSAAVLAGPLSLFAQQSNSGNPVPALVSFSGVLTGSNGRLLTGTVGVTFALYTDSAGGAPLWIETQNVQADKNGHYTVQLGAASSEGLPASVFASGDARWLSVQVEGQEELPRVVLLSVPYALKALDAETIGGKPASSFMLATQAEKNAAGPAKLPPGTITGSGTADFLPMFTGTTTIGNSKVYQNPSGDVGIGTTSPAATLDVKGKGDVRDTLTLFPKSSHPSLSVSGTAFEVNNKGVVTFVSGQSFPGAGTVTSVGSGAGLTGGPITGSGTLSIASAGVTNAMLQNSIITLNANSAGGVTTPGAMTLGSTYTIGLQPCSANQVLEYNGSAWSCAAAGTGTITGVTAGTDLTGGGTSGNVTLNLDTTKVPQLAANNSFTGNQTVNGNLSATGAVSGNSYQIGSNLFAFGSYGNSNAFLGFAGSATANQNAMYDTAVGFQALPNDTASGGFNVAIGADALFSNTTGNDNTAAGDAALYSNTAGHDNTANGLGALLSNITGYGNTATGSEPLTYNTTGNDNTAAGYAALYSNTTGNYNTASGFAALYNNTTTCCNTAVGSYALQASNTGGSNASYENDAFGYQTLYSNTIGVNNAAFGAQALYSNTTGYWNLAFGNLTLASNTTGYANNAFGLEALGLNTTGNQNNAFGTFALFGNQTGYPNDAFGYNALLQNRTGEYNEAFGYQALLQNNGSYNTAVGAGALYSNITGNDLTCIGYECSAGEDGLSNATAIGAHAVVSQSNSLVLGGTGKYSVKVGIGTSTPSNILTIARGAGYPVSDSWETYSSRRWKTNIHTLPDALARVEQLRGVSYDLKDSGKHEIGVIAEEVGAVVPEVVTYEDNGTDARGVDYSRLTALLIEATKEQQTLIRQQQQQIRAQQAKMKAQETRIDDQQAQINSSVKLARTQQAQIAELMSQVKAIQVSLKANRHADAEVRTVKAQAPIARQ